MPRNASGTYSLPSGNPVQSGTLIDATWANNTLNDLANEMTDSLSRSGEGGMLAPFRLNDGVQATPGLAFTNEPSTGLYRAGTNEAWLVVGGTQVQQLTNNGVVSRFAVGAVATPSLTFSGDLNTGLWSPAADTLALSTGGVEALRVNSSQQVGVGTNSPGVRLDVTGPAGAEQTIRLTSFIDGSIATPRASVFSLRSGTTPIETARIASFNRFANANGGDLVFSTADTSNVLQTRAVIDSSGNVGIGTAVPGRKLDVIGAMSAGNGTIATGFSWDTRGLVTTFSNHALGFATNNSAPAMLLDTSGNLGIGTASPGDRLDVFNSATNSTTGVSIRNSATSGAFTATHLRLFSWDGSTVAIGGALFQTASTFAYQQIGANQLNVYGTKAGGIRLATANSGPIIFAPTTGADADFATEVMRITPAGNIVAGASAALATTATNGFLYVPTCAGVPTGTPTAVTGMAPIVVDTTNNRWYFYSNGAWRNAGP